MFNDAGAGMTRSTVTLMVLPILLGLEQPRTAAHKAVALVDCMLKQQIKTDEGRTAKAGFAVHVEALLSVSHFVTEDRNSIVSYSLSSVASKSFSARVELANTERVRSVRRKTYQSQGRSCRNAKVVLVPCTRSENPEKSGAFSRETRV